jgi:hypothetical protein
MENTSNQQNEPNTNDRPADEAAGGPAASEQETRQRPFDAFFSAMRDGAEDARKAAAQAIPKIKSAAANALYWSTYGVSYAAVFQWTVAKHFTPESVKTGARDGVKAGREAAEQWIEKLRNRKDAKSTGSPAESAPTGEAVQPGIA